MNKLKFFTYTLRVLKVPYIDTKELAKIIEENTNFDDIEDKIIEKSKEIKNLNISKSNFNKLTLPLISVLSFPDENSVMRNKDIKDFAEKEFWKNRSSILPSDYSVWSKYISSDKWFLEHTDKRWYYKLSNLWKKVFNEIK